MAKKKVTGHPWLVKNLGEKTRYAYILPDAPHSRCADPDFWGGAGQSSTYPSIVALRRSPLPNATQWPRQRLSPEWMIYVREINAQNDLHAVTNIFNVESGYFNEAGDPTQQIDPWQIENMPPEEMPKPEFITTSGNIHVVSEIRHTAIKIKTFGLADTPPDPAEFNHATSPPYVVHMMATHKDDYFTLISSGSGHARDVYFPAMCPGDAWVLRADNYCGQRYELLPVLPLVVTVTSDVGLTVRATPSETGTPVGSVRPDHSVKITRYHPDFSTGGIWGQVRDGYVCIQHVKHMPYPSYPAAFYYTDFRLSAIPALRPRHGFPR